jgi:TrmH family RNA methyltransferase
MRTIAEGLHLVQAADDAAATIDTVVTRAHATEAAQALAARVATRQPAAKRVELAAPLYDAIAPVEHGAGVLVELLIPPNSPLTALDSDIVYLDGVQDPGNVGTLLRTAAAAGVKTVLAGPGCAALWAPKVMRAGMGAHFVLRLHEEVGPETAAQRFAGVVLAADSNASEDLYGAAWGSPSLWLFGAEGRGLGSAARAIAQRRLRIPIDTRVESLNVAAAVAVCLFEQRRRRLAAK